MSLLVLETKWKSALTSILEHLTQSELRKLLFKLDKIPQGLTNETPRERLPDIIIQHYGTEGSISVINKEMKVLPRNDARVQEPLRPFVDRVKQLKKQRQETKGQLNSCQPEKKKGQLSGQGSIERKRKMDPVGVKKPEPKTEQQETLNLSSPSLKPDETTKTSKMDPVGVKKPKHKTEQQETLNLSSPSLKPDETTKTSKVPSEALQTGRVKIIGIKVSNTRNTHLDVEFNGELKAFYVTTRLLADAFGIKANDDFKEIFSSLMPLNAEAQIQGKRIIAIKNYTYL
ncbi:uncharacterized protein LOC117743114 isoform X1 [Cyclopterus lumpus]|uniref:uncharacterized protein LOC117743114 isoform X1 n=1 Tax=Cyclopterus lumpus TaxID=8103 RepID=UPI001486B442|nr:uncharacterized protein LOC117743114 isoform X1 [Cyclopterus lumpus]XP_034406787.1 uncharacterized protein LOC117743114 isoform X1 [Cyclopterus lumpus]XP_034406789.1 uncharacterized protein LOC117743114 isoform X1 [Cyclopterus lumpus]